MKLRDWQSECVNLALNNFTLGKKHFLCLATPGAGKTIMAATLANTLLKRKEIDFVLCVSPSVSISQSTQASFEITLGTPFNGKFGSVGMAITYQSLPFLTDEFWHLFSHYRILVVLDEVHHCAGHDIAGSNAWGLQVLTKLQSNAKFLLSLTGTPWRTDSALITSVEYCETFGQADCDYQYGLERAISESVCRPPIVTAIDNNKISFRKGRADNTSHYSSLTELMEKETLAYQHIINNPQVLAFCIQEANKKLNQIRKHNPSAAGFVVASSVEHAYSISALFNTHLQESPEVVTHNMVNSAKKINDFRVGDNKWLISVGMVSEGTDIPRQQVCCHLTRIRTELHFRQVLGRIMRKTKGEKYHQAHLYVPAQPDILIFAKRLTEDLPDGYHVLNNIVLEKDIEIQEPKKSEPEQTKIILDDELPDIELEDILAVREHYSQESAPLLTNFLSNLSIEGQFKQYLVYN